MALSRIFYPSPPLLFYLIKSFSNLLKSGLFLFMYLTQNTKGCFVSNVFFWYSGIHRQSDKETHADIWARCTVIWWPLYSRGEIKSCCFSTQHVDHMIWRLLDHSLRLHCLFPRSHPALGLHRGTSRCLQILHKGALYGSFPTILRYNVSVVPRLSAAVRTRAAFDGGLCTVHTVHFLWEEIYFRVLLWWWIVGICAFAKCVFKAFPFQFPMQQRARAWNRINTNISCMIAFIRAGFWHVSSCCQYM